MSVNAIEGSRVMSVEDASAALLDPSAYADGRVEQAFAVLRHESPVHWVESEAFAPFHALTRHADVARVERLASLFHAGPRYKLYRTSEEPPAGGARAIIMMDPPDHTAYRALTAEWFHHRNLARFEADVRARARAIVDAMANRTQHYDFVGDVSMRFPLAVICSMLGIPDADQDLILRMTQRNFGQEDPEYQELAAKALGIVGKAEFADHYATLIGEFAAYFAGVVEDRRVNPTDDISSLLTHATLDGEPVPVANLVGYFVILATAGHDTTSASIAGGMRALIEHPAQLQRLRDEPELIPSAVEEMLRWTSPVKSFMRVAMADTEIGGHPIAEGDAVLLVYPSANRDEKVFENPTTFDITRDPNPHLAFGKGAHFCLGNQLARMEMRVFFEELLPRLRSIELAGDPELVKTLFVGGHKHLPVRAEVV